MQNSKLKFQTAMQADPPAAARHERPGLAKALRAGKMQNLKLKFKIKNFDF